MKNNPTPNPTGKKMKEEEIIRLALTKIICLKRNGNELYICSHDEFNTNRVLDEIMEIVSILLRKD